MTLFETWIDPYGESGSKELKGYAPTLLKWVSEGVFTPVVGAGCPRIGIEDSEGIKRIANQVCHHLAELDEGSDEFDFLDSLIRRKRVPVDAGTAEPPAIEGLYVFRKAAIRAGAALTTVFGLAMSRKNEPVLRAAGHTVEAGAKQSEQKVLQTVREALADAAQAAGALDALAMGAQQAYEERNQEPDRRKWQRRWQDHPGHDLWRLFGPAGVRRRLSLIVASIPEGDTSVSIPMSWLEWLADLVWHSFRFDSQLYPSSEELAFLLAMTCGFEATIDKAELALAAQDALQDVNVQEHLTRALELPGRLEQRPSSAPQDPESRQLLYDALAISLLEAYKNRVKEAPFPMALTTNYDLELELALLERAEDPERFHVVIPVLVVKGNSKSPRHATPDWLIGGFRRGASVRDADWEWCPQNLDVGHLGGPVVVKLHGSPLHAGIPGQIKDHMKLAQDLEQRGRHLQFEDEDRLLHATVVSEFEYLWMIVAENKGSLFPWWLLDQLNKKARHTVFLGQSVQDWNIRLRLFSQLYEKVMMHGAVGRGAAGDGDGNEGQRVFLDNACAINRKFDPVRASLLRWLGVTQIVGDLADLADLLWQHSPRIRFRGRREA